MNDTDTPSPSTTMEWPAGAVVRTTTGDVAPEKIGITSVHEHLVMDIRRAWLRLRGPEWEGVQQLPVTLENLGDVRWNAFSVEDNMVLPGIDVMAEELARWRVAGGSTVVELSSAGLEPDHDAIARIGEAAGVQVVLGFGHYVHPSHDPWVCAASVDELERVLDREARSGAGSSSLLPGVLGEIGMGAPPKECERRALRAAARVAARYGMSVHIHVDNAGTHGPEHVRDCLEEGLEAERVLCGHADERLDRDHHIAMLETGAMVGFDTFGSELYFSGAFHHPSDQQRMEHLAELIQEGFVDRIVLAHDVAVKAHLRRYGGNGFDHLLRRVAPALRSEFEVSQEDLEAMLVHNPRRLLACTPPHRVSES